MSATDPTPAVASPGLVDKLALGQHHVRLGVTLTDGVLRYINKVKRASLDELCEIFGYCTPADRNLLHSVLAKLSTSKRIISTGKREERRYHAVPVDLPGAPLTAPRTWFSDPDARYVPEPSSALRAGAMDFARLQSVGQRC